MIDTEHWRDRAKELRALSDGASGPDASAPCWNWRVDATGLWSAQNRLLSGLSHRPLSRR